MVEQFASGAARHLLDAAAAAIWLVIERTESCTRFFDWVGRHPEYEIDSAILAFMLAAVGITVFAWRRYREMKAATRAREAAEREYHTLAYHDPLTGLPNRRALQERLQQAHAMNEKIGLVLLDLDRFKGVNDLHGHATGDRLLRLVAQRIGEALGPGQFCCRIGGDEFALVVAGCQQAVRTAQRIVQAIAHPFEDGGLVHRIGASAGIAHYPCDARDPEGLIRAADVALYRAKEAGRSQCQSFDPAMDEQIRQRARTEQELRLGVTRKEFLPYYQPVVSLATGEIEGFELLARWVRPDGINIGPETFIPIAEECGLIDEIMFSMLDHACKEAREWDPKLTVAINLSPSQLMDPQLSQRILATLLRNGFPPRRLGIEITEDAIIADEISASQVIESFKNQGIRIALDDFGTGYSSLHHLRLLPFDKIKIDRSFVQGLDRDSDDIKIVTAIIGLAQSLDLAVIAEGIETAEVADKLLALGCSQGQGYYFGVPIPGSQVERLWSAGPPRRQATG